MSISSTLGDHCCSEEVGVCIGCVGDGGGGGDTRTWASTIACVHHDHHHTLNMKNPSVWCLCPMRGPPPEPSLA